MLMPVDIAGGQVSGVDSLSSAASSIRNWEVDEAGINRPRAGLATHTVTGFPADPVIGLEHWSRYIIAATDDRKLWSIPDVTPTFAGALSSSSTATQIEGSAGRIVFALGDDYVYAAGGSRIQRWGPSLALSECLTSSPRCTHIASLGQRLIANDVDDPSAYRWSDIGEGTWGTWPAANTANAEARPDPVLALYENANELFIFGSETLQVHAVGSDPTLPFEQVSTINTGLGAPYAACRLDETFCFLDDKRRVVISDGRSIKVISDAIQRDLRSLTTISDCWMYREERAQFSYIVVRFPTARRTFVYDTKGERWRERDYYESPFAVDFPVSAHAYWPSTNYHLFGSSLSTGGLLRFDEDSRQDIGGALVSEITTGWQTFSTNNRKRFGASEWTFRRGTAAQGATPGALEVRVQYDDRPWTAWQQLSVGVPSDYAQVRKCFATAGIGRRKRYGVRFSNTEEMSFVGLSDDVTDLEAERP